MKSSFQTRESSISTKLLAIDAKDLVFHASCGALAWEGQDLEMGRLLSQPPFRTRYRQCPAVPLMCRRVREAIGMMR